MIKQDIITKVASEISLSEYDVRLVIDETISTITRALQNSEEVTLRGFGVFKIVERKPRVGRNLNTGEPIYIGSHRVVQFEPGKDLKNI